MPARRLLPPARGTNEDHRCTLCCRCSVYLYQLPWTFSGLGNPSHEYLESVRFQQSITSRVRRGENATDLNEVWVLGGTISRQPGWTSPDAIVGVAALSAKSLWIISRSLDLQGRDHGSIEHWNGKKWIAFSPTWDSSVERLYAIAAVSSRNVWVVGGNPSPSGGPSLVEHWNGSRWTRIAVPSDPTSHLFGPPDLLTDVAASSANNVWVAGETGFGDGGDMAFFAHFDGSQWTSFSDFADGLEGAYYLDGNILGVAPISSNYVLAVGDDEGSHYQNYVWSKGWRAVESPLYTTAVAAVSKKNAWAVGDGIEHWNGKDWTALPAQTLPPKSTLEASRSAANDMCGRWANTRIRVVDFVFCIEHWNGVKWTNVPGPNCRQVGETSLAFRFFQTAMPGQ